MFLYLVVGIGVAAAVYLACEEGSIQLWFRMATAVPFWPLYLPVLLATPRSSTGDGRGFVAQPPVIDDDMTTAIAQVDAELQAALNSLDGWAEDVLARERDRIRELRDAWNAQANRVREMDRLLAVLAPTHTLLDPSEIRVAGEVGWVEASEPTSPAKRWVPQTPPTLLHLPLTNSDSPAKNRLVQSQEACQENIKRLRSVRQRTYDDLLSNLAWVRELVSMIHLAKFTGAPASRAEELVAQIAAAVEGLSDLTWREETTVAVQGSGSDLK
jgi:hypothetical protein